jgi:hypothetical protein
MQQRPRERERYRRIQKEKERKKKKKKSGNARVKSELNQEKKIIFLICGLHHALKKMKGEA